jgi:hypothetical protein
MLLSLSLLKVSFVSASLESVQLSVGNVMQQDNGSLFTAVSI